jgi:hypothetical protein
VDKAIFWRVGGSPRYLLLPNGNPPPPHPRITGELGKSPLSREVIGVNGTELVLVLALGVLVALVVASQI